MLSKEPDKRPANARLVAETIWNISGGTTSSHSWPPTGIRGPSGFMAAAAKTGKPKQLVVAGAVGAVVLAGALYFFLAKPFGPHAGHADPKQPDSGVSGSSNDGRVPGASLAQGVSDNEILLGMSAAFSGPSRELGRDMKLGLETAFHEINDQGGVTGRKIRLVALDDGYEPEQALKNMRQLYEDDKIFAVIGNVGTPTTEKALPYALEKRFLLFGPFTGAGFLRRDPPDRYVFNYRASYAEETGTILKYLVEFKKLKPEQIAVFAQRDAFGDAGFAGVAKAMRKYGVDPAQILRTDYPRNTVEVVEAVNQIRRHAEIRAVVMAASYAPAARFIQRMRDAKYDGIFTNVSFVGSVALAEDLKQYGPSYVSGVIVTQVVPNIESQSSLVLKFRELLKRYSPNERPSFVALEGYIDGVIFAEGLKRAGRELATDSLIQALESINNLDLGIGTPITFGPSEHQASHKVWATELNGVGDYSVLELD
jgi:ABC-type branched-subunit amino acid transport system substrate-binding protein